MKKQFFYIIASLYTVAVIYLAATTPISPHEANILYTSHDIVAFLMKSGQEVTDSFLGLRLFFLLFGFASIVLFHSLSKLYLDKPEDINLSTLIFMFLPGMVTGMALVNIAIVVLPVVLLFVWMYEKGYFWVLPFFMLILFFIHEASIIFFIAVFVYAVVYKDKKLAIIAGAFLAAFVFLAKGIAIGGRPSGHFAEIFGLYATLFSPFVFLYFFYVMYRILLREKKRLLWYISFTALIFSLLLSIRQKIHLTDFAPYVLIAVPIMLATYYRSLRVRLLRFQKVYRQGFYFVMLTLVINFLIIVTHQATYHLSNNNPKHFAHRIYQPYEKAMELHKAGMTCYDGQEGRESLQFRYYQISLCNN